MQMVFRKTLLKKHFYPRAKSICFSVSKSTYLEWVIGSFQSVQLYMDPMQQLNPTQKQPPPFAYAFVPSLDLETFPIRLDYWN